MGDSARCGIRGCPAKGMTRTAAVMAGIEHVHPNPPAVPDPTVEALSDDERHDVLDATWATRVEVVERILAEHTERAVREARAEVWDEAAEATADWIGRNPPPSGIWSDPPTNPYHEGGRP